MDLLKKPKPSVEVYTGTSGYSYPLWAKFSEELISFYPGEKPKIGQYAEVFQTVEIDCNNFDILAEQIITFWYDNTPEDFVFSVRAPQNIDFDNFATWWFTFQDLFSNLKEKWKSIVFCIEERKSIGIFTNIVESFDLLSQYQYLDIAFEFKHESWHSSDVYEMIGIQENITMLITNLVQNKETSLPDPDLQDPEKILENMGYQIPECANMANFCYFRFYGYKGRYVGTYGEDFLQSLKYLIQEYRDKHRIKRFYVYFANVNSWDIVPTKFMEKAEPNKLFPKSQFETYVPGNVPFLASAILDAQIVNYKCGVTNENLFIK